MGIIHAVGAVFYLIIAAADAGKQHDAGGQSTFGQGDDGAVIGHGGKTLRRLAAAEAGEGKNGVDERYGEQGESVSAREAALRRSETGQSAMLQIGKRREKQDYKPRAYYRQGDTDKGIHLKFQFTFKSQM